MKHYHMENQNDAFICNKGVAFLELNSYDRAIECFRRALVINPSNEDARILKDECLENYINIKSYNTTLIIKLV